MDNSFSFCGTDVTVFGLHYAPVLQNTYVYQGATGTPNEVSFDGHHGGYYFGTSMKPKIFSLRCYFENTHINNGLLSKITSFFKSGKTGKLVFQNRSWVWYIATVVSCDVSNIISYMNGYVTITMKAYYPFGRCDFMYVPDDQVLYPYIRDNSGLVEKLQMPKYVFENITNKTDFLLHNGGSQYAHVSIMLKGDIGQGVIIRNKTTGNECKLIKPSNDSLGDGQYLICDALTGKTIIKNEETEEARPAFMWHDHGFIELEPSCPVGRDVYVQFEAGSKTASVFNETIDYAGYHIAQPVGNDEWKWIKIEEVTNESKIKMEEEATETVSPTTVIAKMNEMEIIPVSSMNISKISFIYKPTFE